MMNRSIIILACCCSVLLLAGCADNPTIVAISATPQTLSAEPTVLTLAQPLHRTNSALSIRIQIKEPWTPEPPWKVVRLQDGTKAIVEAVLISKAGTQYHPVLIGAAGGLDIRFNDTVPKDIKIEKVVITSSHPLTALNVKWVDWNPK